MCARHAPAPCSSRADAPDRTALTAVSNTKRTAPSGRGIQAHAAVSEVLARRRVEHTRRAQLGVHWSRTHRRTRHGATRHHMRCLQHHSGVHDGYRLVATRLLRADVATHVAVVGRAEVQHVGDGVVLACHARNRLQTAKPTHPRSITHTTLHTTASTTLDVIHTTLHTTASTTFNVINGVYPQPSPHTTVGPSLTSGVVLG